ncbi:MAG: hypothetical protein U0792_04760 [Gemmataceae bacterium]
MSTASNCPTRIASPRFSNLIEDQGIQLLDAEEDDDGEKVVVNPPASRNPRRRYEMPTTRPTATVAHGGNPVRMYLRTVKDDRSAERERR